MRHGDGHWWGSLGWICDLAELIRTRSDVRWEWVLNEARRLHGERLVLLGLALASELLRAPIPEFIGARIQVDPAIPWLIATARSMALPRGRRPARAERSGPLPFSSTRTLARWGPLLPEPMLVPRVGDFLAHILMR